MVKTSDTTGRILDAAQELFAHRGFSATTTRAIAEGAGVNEVTLFRRFSSKAGILRALSERLAAGQAGHAALDSQDRPARELIADLARMEVRTALGQGGLAIRLAFDARSVPEVAEIVGDAAAANLQKLAHYLARRQTAGELRADLDAELMAQAFFGLTSSYVMYRLLIAPEGSVDPRAVNERVDELLELFWSGARPVTDDGGKR